jgi:hypothetical protein
MNEHIERIGRGRREQDKRCGLCETIWKFHDTEKEEYREGCKSKVPEITENIKGLSCTLVHKVDWRVFTIALAIIVSILSWITLDHFGLSKQVAFNTAVITGINEKVDLLIKGQIEIKHSLNGKQK